jgi:serine/threonine protein kinase
MKEVRHPDLLPILGAWQRDDYLILTMELADCSLLDRLKAAVQRSEPGIPLPELMEYMRQAATGIDHLHARGIQHRDIKPQNLLVVSGGVKVADFGLMKLLESLLCNRDRLGALPYYMAPEWFHRQSSNQSDQYALAISYIELRTGQLPFGAKSVYEVMGAHLEDKLNFSQLPEAEQPILRKATTKNPQDRWPSCRAFVDTLATEAA